MKTYWPRWLTGSVHNPHTTSFGNSVTRWLEDFKYLANYNIMVPPKHQKIAKVGLKYCETLNKLSIIWQRLIKFDQSLEISPNLVTLFGNGVCAPFTPKCIFLFKGA